MPSVVKYFPFCGNVNGHPSLLHGSVKEIIADGFEILYDIIQTIVSTLLYNISILILRDTPLGPTLLLS